MIIAAVLLAAFPSGRFAATVRQALTIFLSIFTVVLVVQSIVVASANGDLPLSYWLVASAALVAGLLLLWLGVTLRRRSASTAPSAA